MFVLRPPSSVVRFSLSAFQLLIYCFLLSQFLFGFDCFLLSMRCKGSLPERQGGFTINK